MILHHSRSRPAPWSEWRKSRPRAGTAPFAAPFLAIEWSFEWLAFALSNWILVEVLEYLGTFSVLIAVVFYFSESGDRTKQRHYQAWQVINTAQGKGGSGGRIEALQELNADRVPLVGVDVSTAFLQGVNLRNANLLRANLSAADLRNSNLAGSNLTLASLDSANLRNAALDHAHCAQADFHDADLNGSSLVGVDLSGATVEDADLRSADLRDIAWRSMGSVRDANIAGVRNPPPGFLAWALANGAISNPDAIQ
jgi:Pentapeptide repeats (8 copies)